MTDATAPAGRKHPPGLASAAPPSRGSRPGLASASGGSRPGLASASSGRGSPPGRSSRPPRRGRALGLAAALAVVLVPAVLILGWGGGSDRSTLDRGPEGSAALASVLAGLGHEVESMRVGLVPLTRQPAGSVLIQASAPGLVPAAVLSETEVELLRRFVEEGSTAVVVTHFPTLVLEELGIGYDWEALPRLDRGGSRWREAAPVLPGPVTVGEPLAIQGRGGLEPSTLDDVLYAALGVPVVTERSVGEGSLVVVSDPWILSNAGLRHGGNLEFWVRLVDDRLRPGGLVLFDDLHAGATDGKGVVAYARRAGVLPAILLVLVALGLYGWRAGSRFGAVLPGVDARNPRASAELVHAVAGLYERADLRGHALAVLSRRFRRNLERRSGQAWDRGGLGPWVASELGPDAARQFARIKRGFGALLTVHLPDRDETLELARLVHDFEAQWLRPGRRTDDTKGA